MAANTLPSGLGDLFSLAQPMERALARYGMWLLKGFTTAEKFGGLLAAARDTERDFSLARAEKAAAAKRFAALDEELTAWLGKARLVVMLALGSQWSESWVAAGFSHRGTNVPKRVALRMELGRRLTDFFGAHPEYEVGFAGVTAKRGRSLAKAIVAAQAEMQMTKAAATAKKRSRDAAEKKLRRAMSAIVGILPCVIGKSDPRWLEFGLKQPRPDAPPMSARYDGGVSIATPLAVDFGARSGTSGSNKAAA
ncbi:MAG: hypothetical protein H0X34_18970 [Chthoniobacterales bacterium]|nr:hypothetical protein [Chthoniobacterales bacterium]